MPKSRLKARRSPVSTDRRFKKANAFADHGTRERWQHSGRTLETTERAGVLAARASEEHVVDVLVLRGILRPGQRAAALKFKGDYQRAAIEGRLTGCYDATRAIGDHLYRGRERSDFEEAAYRRWRNAVRALGQLLSGTVISIVCHDRAPGPRDVPRLTSGLDRLADWYGLPNDEPATTPPRRGPSRQDIDDTAAR
ncbi:MAG TPA: DUF6456 domain-containing protein [Alphaproteobacteria bacterium]|nr:DUF6456 domain-containing protein [Alphaproteobacteria bacterium]